MSTPYYDCIAHHAMRRPDALAAVDLATGRRWSYQAFDERISRLAGSFRAQGVIAGERVAILAPNSTDTFEVQFACGRIGAIFVPLNWRLATPELRAILGDCAPCGPGLRSGICDAGGGIGGHVRRPGSGFNGNDV
jgi:fatty-acyl-CoA synthase